VLIFAALLVAVGVGLLWYLGNNFPLAPPPAEDVVVEEPVLAEV